MFWGQTQYKFQQTTNEHGALLDDDEFVDINSNEIAYEQPKSLWQKTQESAVLFSCFKCCRRRRDNNTNVDENLDSSVYLDQESHQSYMDNSALLEHDQYVENKGFFKKRVVPNNNQDKWLFYLLQNLNKANDLPWVNELLA